MQTIYKTSIVTGIIISLFLVVMAFIDSPLGGQPFTIIGIKDRSQAETELAKKKTLKLAEKRNQKKNIQRKEQKNPLYFGKSQSDNSVTLRGKNEDDNKDINHLTPNNLLAKQKTKNELEYIGKIGLPPAPVAELVEKSQYGPLPRISDSGRRPLEVYARPPSNYDKSKPAKLISIIVTGLGLSEPITKQAIDTMPAEVTLSFNPYASQLKKWGKRARSTGHETLLEIPMEPFDYPDNDPGPHTLLSFQSDEINIDRLNWLMARMVGYVGVINVLGGKFINEENALLPVMREMKNRGLVYMDSNPEAVNIPYNISEDIKLEYLQSSIIIDKLKTKTAIENAFKRLEKIAEEHGQAIGVISALPVSLKRLAEWTETLKKRGITLVPISQNISNRQS